ncbi:MAG: ferrous iron transport protein A [Flavobacteriia bacterium]|nr:ferrous iron transport protein A [Flavobacteriia bacterium]
MKKLSQCKIGEKVQVIGLSLSEIQSQLVELGLYEGKEISILYKAPFGDPIAVSVGEYVLSMRVFEADQIWVENVNINEEDSVIG